VSRIPALLQYAEVAFARLLMRKLTEMLPSGPGRRPELAIGSLAHNLRSAKGHILGEENTDGI